MTVFTRMLLGAILFMLINIGALAQSSKLLPEIEPALRKTFHLRLKELLKYQAAEAWAEAYKLSISSLGGNGKSLADFVVEMTAAEKDGSRFRGFEPRYSVLVNEINGSKVWMIEGCATYSRKMKTVRLESGLSAMLYQGNWFFDNVTVIPDAVGGSERPCKVKRSERKSSRKR